MPNFKALGIYFIFGTNFFWNEWIGTRFKVKCALLGRNFTFLGGYWSLFSGHCLLLIVTWLLLVVTSRYRLLLIVPTFGMIRVKTKNDSNFTLKVAKWSNRSFSVYLVNHLFQITKSGVDGIPR